MLILETLIKKTYTVMWEPSDLAWTTTSDVVIPKINDVIRRICSGRIFDIVNWWMIQGRFLPFLASTLVFDIISDKTLTQAVIVWDTKIYMLTTWMSVTGTIIIWESVIPYTSLTSTYINVSTSSLSYDSWSTARVLYTLPINIDKPISLRKNWEEINFVSEEDPVYLSKYYSIIGWKLYIKWVTWRVVLKYQIFPTDLVSNTDICLLDNYWSLISQIAAWEILYDLEEVEDAKTKLIQWYSQLKEFYSYYSTRINKQNSILPQPLNLLTTYGRKAYKNR